MNRRRDAKFLALLCSGFLLLCTSLTPSLAWACSYSLQSWTLPTGLTPAPTNTRIWLYREAWAGELQELDQDQVRLQDEMGRLVPTSFSKIVVRGNAIERRLYVLTPEQPLAPVSTYHLFVERQRANDGATYSNVVTEYQMGDRELDVLVTKLDGFDRLSIAGVGGQGSSNAILVVLSTLSLAVGRTLRKRAALRVACCAARPHW